MAKYGAKYLKFAPIKDQPEDKLPTYEPGVPIQVGKVVQIDLTPNMASGRLDADDELAENLEVFSSGTLAAETDDMLDEVAAVVYGCKVEEGMVHYHYGDTPPEGGLGYVIGLMRRGVPSYKGIFHPRVKATLGGESYQTRGQSITFSTTKTTFTVFCCNSGHWRITHECATEKEAKEWVDEMLAGAETDGGGEDTGGGAGGEDAPEG